MNPGETKRIGVFVCHCGLNIAGIVDVEKVISESSKYPNIVIAGADKYLCSEPGQKLIQNAIKEKRLEGVVIAACSPTMHETTFRNASARSGLNPYLCEIANIREQCSWVHQNNKEKATEKAIKIIRSITEKVKLNLSLEPVKVPVTKRCLVVGGGITGIQAALDVAEAGYEVYLVEKTPSIGGHMAQLSETFPTLDCSQCILTPKMVAASKHPNIHILTYSEVMDVSGYVGNFKIKILKKPRYVNEKCNLCGECEKACPVIVPNEFDEKLSPRKAVYIPFPQAVPAIYCIDRNACLGLMPVVCSECKKVCEPNAIDYDMAEEILELDVGCIIAATGYELYNKEKLGEYGYGKYPDVIDGLQYERLLSASGPTGGEIRRPSDCKIPKEIVFIQCAGSRDPDSHMPYCSKICCMYTAKHAMLYKHKVPDGQAYIFYIDIRAGGKGYEEFVQRATEEDKVLYLRGKVSKIYEENGSIVVLGTDTISNKNIEIRADMVVLAAAVVPNSTTKELAAKLKLNTDQFGFITEAHPKLRPVESLTSGIFVAGCAQAPKDIPESVAQGSGAASKSIGILSQEQLSHEPIVAYVTEELCSGCGICATVCPYKAIEVDKTAKVARVNEVLCEGCGSCVSACPSNAVEQKNYRSEQIFKMIEVIV